LPAIPGELSLLAAVASGGIFGFGQIYIAFSHEALVSSKIFQNSACLNHFLEAADE
jgi:hypothetical protein